MSSGSGHKDIINIDILKLSQIECRVSCEHKISIPSSHKRININMIYIDDIDWWNTTKIVNLLVHLHFINMIYREQLYIQGRQDSNVDVMIPAVKPEVRNQANETRK